MTSPGYRPVGDDTNGYTVAGPGVTHRLQPPLRTRNDAETLCRLLAHAFMAGEERRAADIRALLESGR